MIRIDKLPENIMFLDLKIGDTFVIDLEKPQKLYVKIGQSSSLVVYSVDYIDIKQVNFKEVDCVYKVSITFVSVVLNYRSL